MKKRISSLEKMILLSIGFTMSLLVVRVLFTRELTYGFFPWNTLLAVIPLLFSRKLKQRDGVGQVYGGAFIRLALVFPECAIHHHRPFPFFQRPGRTILV